MMKTYTVDEVANWFLSKGSMSPKKLQKLVYYAYAWYLTLNNSSVDHIDNLLFNEPIQAWNHGSVIPCLYHEYKIYKYHEIAKLDGQTSIDVDADGLAVLNNVWDVYGHYPADELEQLIHSEIPWKKANEKRKLNSNRSETILPKDIYAYYVNQSLDDVPFNMLMVQIDKNKDVFEWLKDK